MSEEDFRSRLMAELSDEEPPPLTGVVAAALGEGLRQRRRRRVAQVLGSAAGVTALAFAASAAARAGIGNGEESAGAGPTEAITATPTAWSTQPATAPAPDATASPAPTDQKAASTWPAQPPGGAATSPSGPRHWTPPPPWMTGGNPPAPADGVPGTAQAVAAVLIDDLGKLGGGPVTHLSGGVGGGSMAADGFWNLSTVGVRVFSPARATPVTCAGIEAGSTCADYKLADGTQVEYFYIPGRPNTADIKAGKIQANMVITRPDGTEIVVIALDGREQGLYGPDRADLPLTEQQLWGIASDPRLGTVMDRDFVKQSDKIALNHDPY